MQVLKLDGRNVVAGLDWEELASEDVGSDKEARKTAARQANASKRNFGRLVTGSSGVVSLALSAKKGKGEVGAAMLAQASGGGSLLLVSAAGDGFWVCAIKEGVPLDDSLVSESSLKDHLIRTGRFLGGSFKFCSADTSIHAFFDDDEKFSAVEKSEDGYAQLTSGKPLPMEQFGGISAAGMAVLAVVLLVIISVAGYMWWSKNERKKRMVRENAERVQKQQQEETAKREAIARETKAKIDQAVREGNDTIMRGMTVEQAAAMVYAWEQVIFAQKIRANGWRYNKATCDPVSCSFELKRSRWGTSAALKDTIPEARIISADTATYSVNVVKGAFYSGEKSVRNLDMVNRDVMSSLQGLRDLGLETTYKDAQEVSIKGPPAVSIPGQPPQAPANMSLGVARGIWEVKGSQMWQFGLIRQALQYKEISAAELSMSFVGEPGTDTQWTIKGSYIYGLPQPKVQPVKPPVVAGNPAIAGK